MISMNWVKDYVNLEGEDLKELAVKITKAGVNIEGVITNHIDNLVIGEILDCRPHLDSDHLNVCQVNVGTDTRQIVCGASNVRTGLKVIVALPGAKLPGDFEIKAGKIRGEESNGMICALFELGLEEKTEETYNAGITELGDDAVVGADPLEYLGLDDTLYDVDIHKHRNNDCYYHIGFAYEVGTILGRKVTLPEVSYNTIKESVLDNVKLNVETSKCPLYLARMVKNVKIGESPDFIKKRLISAGMRPINNVVDISNYVMLEYGNPLHFFDKDALGDKILVRDAKEDEVIITLDGKERVLKSSDIVITDGEKPVCIAGVMGGENTEVEETTKNILIEAAIFDAVSIRDTAAHLDLKSEASTRYGKGLNYEYTYAAMERAVELLQKYAGGEVLSDMVVVDNTDKSEKTVDFRASEINKMLGIELTNDDVKTELERLDFVYSLDKDVFHVIIPRRRLDIDPNIADMAEEIGRLYGYHNLVSTLPSVTIRRGKYVGDVGLRKNISKRLRALGLNESKNYTLVNPDMAKLFKYDNKENKVLPNPMSVDKSVIRTNIVPSLLNVYEYNKARKVNDVMLYEIAKTYDVNYEEETKIGILIKGTIINNNWNNIHIKADFYVLKGIVENVLDYIGFKNRYSFEIAELPQMHPGMTATIMLDREVIGYIGRVHPSIKKDEIYVAEISLTKLMKTTKPIKFKEASKYPEIVKDAAWIVDNSIKSSDIEAVIKKTGGRLLDSVEIFDIYRDIENGKKSMAYKMVFKDATRTLSDEEVMEVFNKIISDVESKLNAKLRN